MASQESEDTCEMCGWGEWGRWGHMCGSLKYLTFFFFFFFFTLELSWGVTKVQGWLLWLRKNGRKKEKRKRKGKWVGSSVGQAANKYIKSIEYIWVTSVHNIVKIYCENVADITLFEKRNAKAKYFFTKSFIKRVIYY